MKKAKPNFLNIVAHEIATPLSNVVNILNILENNLSKKDLDLAETRTYLQLAKDQTKSIMPKLKDFMAYVNFDEETIISTFSAIKISEVISKVVEKYSTNKYEEVSISFHEIDDVPAKVLVDSDHLYQVLSVVVGNAAKFTTKGSIDISLKTAATKNKGQKYFEISVVDTGPGIHEKELIAIKNQFNKEKTFNEYDKVSARIPYIFLLVTKVLKGEFDIDSTVNKGTRVTIKFPYQETSATDQEEPIKFPYLALLVEDDATCLQLEIDMLTELGLIVETATTAKEALAKASMKKYDLIFLDITLPDMDGVEVTDHLNDTLCQETPVVALTSHDSEDDMEHFLQHGILTLIPKPITVVDMKNFLLAYNNSIMDDDI